MLERLDFELLGEVGGKEGEGEREDEVSEKKQQSDREINGRKEEAMVQKRETPRSLSRRGPSDRVERFCKEERLDEISSQALGVAAGATRLWKRPKRRQSVFEKNTSIRRKEGIENEREMNNVERRRASFALSLSLLLL